jgi:hypothetical protein
MTVETRCQNPGFHLSPREERESEIRSSDGRTREMQMNTFNDEVEHPVALAFVA